MSFTTTDFSESLKVARVRNKMTQSELAERVGTTSAAVCRWESSNRTPRADSIYRLCEALNLAPNELLGWIDD